jgi:hypothetical protein
LTEIGLTEAIALVREELVQAVEEGVGSDIQFPVGQVTLEFQVGLTKTDDVHGGLKLWVLELGASREYARESVQTISIVLGPPVDATGNPIKVSAASEEIPG